MAACESETPAIRAPAAKAAIVTLRDCMGHAFSDWGRPLLGRDAERRHACKVAREPHPRRNLNFWLPKSMPAGALRCTFLNIR
jgi:hypothetical protein